MDLEKGLSRLTFYLYTIEGDKPSNLKNTKIDDYGKADNKQLNRIETETNGVTTISSKTDDSDDSSSDSDYDYYQEMKNNAKNINAAKTKESFKNDFEIAPMDDSIGIYNTS